MLAAFDAAAWRFPHLIGGGGKTTLMYALARAWVESGRTVITTTTTHILAPRPEESPRLLLGELPAPAIRRELAAHRQVTLAHEAEAPSGKLKGHDSSYLAALRAANVAAVIIVEADGSAGRPLKAPADHEPVIVNDADQVVMVVGLEALGAPLTREHVHRAELFCQRYGATPGQPLNEALVARAVTEGYLGRVPPDAQASVLLRGADGSASRALARRMLAHPRLERVVIGDVSTDTWRVELR